MAISPLIALLSDFGLEDGYPGIMKGVMLDIAPEARFVDITHLIPSQDIATGAWVLHTSWHYFPAGTIFLCIVDPGVGTGRQPVALCVGGRFFVGPDNGLFSYVVAAKKPTVAIALNRTRFHLPNPSTTFHGRDLFAPCAAYLATGVTLEELGSTLDSATLISITSPQPSLEGGLLAGSVAHCDHFGNVITSFGPELAEVILAAPASVLMVGTTAISIRAATFASGPEDQLFMLSDSSGHLAIALRNGSAASRLRVARGGNVQVSGLGQ